MEARIAPETLADVRRAAKLQVLSASGFLIAAGLKDAHRTIEDARINWLSVEHQQRFVQVLVDSPPSAPAMKRALSAQ